ncbi:MAG: GTPase ObgE [Bacteroidetes bacterium]|nr:GTPase ObgE [Bacteroidota bacterium]
MMFIDQAKIFVKSGNGGKGMVSFRREKYVPKGGPDGGTGGKGGDVIIRADRQLTTLLDFRYKRIYKAENGENGKSSNKSGRQGADIVIRVPCGTVIKNLDTGKVVADLVNDKDEIIVAKGGKGGRGNAEFATPTNQAPRHAEPGVRGEEHKLDFELKLIADVGLVGYPNAGKSTLISVISAAKPKIADYPFTTLIPNLGIVSHAENKSFVVADMPGLIEGAHEGRGLGIQFLRHIERTRILAYLIDCTDENPKKTYETLVNEIKLFNKEMLKKPQIIIVTKMDLVDTNLKKENSKINFKKGTPVHFISAVANKGVKDLIKEMWKMLKKLDS